MKTENQSLLTWLNSFITPKYVDNKLNSLAEIVQSNLLFQIFEDL